MTRMTKYSAANAPHHSSDDRPRQQSYYLNFCTCLASHSADGAEPAGAAKSDLGRPPRFPR